MKAYKVIFDGGGFFVFVAESIELLVPVVRNQLLVDMNDPADDL